MGFLQELAKGPSQEQKDAWAQDKDQKAKDKHAESIAYATERLKNMLAEDEQVIYRYGFINNLLAATTKKVIYLDKTVGKTTTYYAVPYSKITNFIYEDPTGMAMTTKVKIYAGGDSPAISIDTKMGDGLIEICQVISSMLP
ncbi:MAG: PH domain-containing protein [Youngiibacter sp.]|nr:PH domain-containing protein [Youngiibacter sp.]